MAVRSKPAPDLADMRSLAARESRTENETAQRAAGMFKLIDSKNLTKGPADQIVREAMSNGAATAEDFSKAFQDAGVKPEYADSIGGLVHSHFALAADERAEIDAQTKKILSEITNQPMKDMTIDEQQSHKRKSRISCQGIEWLLIACLALA